MEVPVSAYDNGVGARVGLWNRGEAPVSAYIYYYRVPESDAPLAADRLLADSCHLG